MSNKKIALEIIALSHSVNQNHSYAVMLGEINGLRRLPIVIGGYEAQAIAVALENMQPSRPLTHDLFCNTLQAFNISLSEIIIHKVELGIFHSKLVCDSEIGTIEIDSRTSDALALAVRFNAPIFTYSKILDVAGMQLNDENNPIQEIDISKNESSENDALGKLSLEKLQELLNDALENEDYILAAKIRDELNDRKW
jgi:bifunctional DNase/RNase